MAKMNQLINQRLKTSEKSGKAAELARHTTGGQRSSFAGVFGLTELSTSERNEIQLILEEYAPETGSDVARDLDSLVSLTSEVKAITNQAAILHGERIKKAQGILKNYKEGAFTAWLLKTYGNRQTPYNFLQYFEFFKAMPKKLHSTIETMPRQAIYTLASRNGSVEDKQEIITNFQGQTKAELLSTIRERFPLEDSDRRKADLGSTVLTKLAGLQQMIHSHKRKLPVKQRKAINDALAEIQDLIS